MAACRLRRMRLKARPRRGPEAELHPDTPPPLKLIDQRLVLRCEQGRALIDYLFGRGKPALVDHEADVAIAPV